MAKARFYRQHTPQPAIDQLRPLSFHSDAADLLVSAVHVFPADGAGIAVSFLLGCGSVNILLPPELAAQVGAGLTKLSRTLSRAGDGAD
jgi:hypothetical protein